MLTEFETNCDYVTIFLVNGVKLSGQLVGLDTDGSYLLARDGVTQKVFRHAAGTIMPSEPKPSYTGEYA
jgi:RNA chaperone Hfq